MTTVGVLAGLGVQEAGIIWFDAHPEFGTPDERADGYFDGMGAAMLTGLCWHTLLRAVSGFAPIPLDRLIFCAIRDFDAGSAQQD